MAKSSSPKLSKNQVIFESHKAAIEGLAAYFGEAFEFVLHDLGDLDHSVIKIVNGFHSGRKEGAPITDLALSMLEEIRKDRKSKKSYTTYFSHSKQGRPVRATTIMIFGEKQKVIGLLCINLYLDSPLSILMETFSPASRANYVTENFINDSDDLIKTTLEKAKSAILEDPAVLMSKKNKAIITSLYNQGIFKLKNAVQIIAEDLEISKNTVYLHVRTLEAKIGSR